MHAATWTLASPITDDHLSLQLGDTVHDTAGNPLDGEWTNSQSAFPSGDGVAGGNFVFQFSVLPGDLNANGTVDFGDVQTTRVNFGMSSGALPAQGDVDGDGDVDFADFQSVQALMNPCPEGTLRSGPNTCLALYAVWTYWDALFQINTSTGQAMRTLTFWPRDQFPGMCGLATNPITGELYGIAGSSSSLVKFDPQTGYPTTIGFIGGLPAGGFCSLTFASDGTLYSFHGFSSDFARESVYRIDPATAAATFVVTLADGFPGDSIVFNPRRRASLSFFRGYHFLAR